MITILEEEKEQEEDLIQHKYKHILYETQQLEKTRDLSKNIQKPRRWQKKLRSSGKNLGMVTLLGDLDFAESLSSEVLNHSLSDVTHTHTHTPSLHNQWESSTSRGANYSNE